MGDRANIEYLENESAPPIYFYTHWGGYELWKTLQDALIRGKDRWNDSQYLGMCRNSRHHLSVRLYRRYKFQPCQRKLRYYMGLAGERRL